MEICSGVTESQCTEAETASMLHSQVVKGTSLMGRLQRDQEFSIPGFPGWDFAKSRDPRIFRDGISLKFFPGILSKEYRISGDFLSAHKFGQLHTFWRTYLFVKYTRQTKVSSIVHSILRQAARTIFVPPAAIKGLKTSCYGQ